MDKKAVLAIMKKHGVKEAYLFGSRARGSSKETSDYDFMVKFQGKKSLLDLVSLQRELRNVLKKPVDVVTERGISPRIKKHIFKVRLL